MKTFIHSTLCSTVFAVCVTAQPVRALMVELSSAPVIVVTDEDAYTVGTRAMNEHRWPDAVSAFDKVIDEKGKRVDSALYWKAYSLNKLGNATLARVTCEQLRAQFAGSTWNKDCDAISMDVQVDAKAV